MSPKKFKNIYQMIPETLLEILFLYFLQAIKIRVLVKWKYNNFNGLAFHNKRELNFMNSIVEQ